MPISMWDLPETEMVYTFVDAQTGEPTHIAASTLRRVVELSPLKPITAEIGGTLVDALHNGTLGVEVEYALTLPIEALERPILICEWGDSHVIADGAHRLWRRWKRGDKDLIAYVIPEIVWREFTIVGVPGSGGFWDDFNRNSKIRS